MAIDVSVIIPAFNGSKTIMQAINSVLGQTYKNYEIIVIDDGSTDSTIELLQTFKRNIRLIQQQNQGTMAARQKGLDSAQGKYIAFLDQDDRWFPRKLEDQLCLFEKDPELGAVLSNLKAVNDDGNVLDFNVVPSHLCFSPSWETLVTTHPVYPSSSLISKAILDKAGGLDCSFGFSGAFGDLDLFVRISEISKIHFMNECTGYYCWSELRPGRLNSFLNNLQVYFEKYRNHPNLTKNKDSSTRKKYILGCSNFALHVYRLLLDQHDNNCPNELLAQLNNHHIKMQNTLGSEYLRITNLQPIRNAYIDCTDGSLSIALYLYLLRPDLQKRFAEVINGKFDKYLKWILNVANGISVDDDYRILNPHKSGIGSLVQINDQDYQIRDRSKFVLPIGSKRRYYYEIIIAGIRLLSTEGLMSFCKKAIRFTLNILFGFKDRIKGKISGLMVKNNISSTKLRILLADEPIRLAFPKFNGDLVTIFVTIPDDSLALFECLESILTYTSLPYRVVLLKDGITKEIDRLLDKLDNVTILNLRQINDINGDVQNQLDNSNYVLLLDSTISVTALYLERMVSLIKSNENYGAIGCKIIKRSGILLEAGGILLNDDIYMHYGFGDNANKPEYSYVREVELSSSNCILIRKDLFNNIYSSCNQDFFRSNNSIRIGKLASEIKYKVIYQPAATVIHRKPKIFASARTKTPFVHSSESHKDLLVARNAYDAPKVLVIDDYIPAIRYGSGFPRLYNMLACLADLGYLVSFFPVGNSVKVQPDTWELQQKGIEIFWGNDIRFEQFIKQRSKYYDLVLISRPHVFEKMLPILNKFSPKSVLAYDAEALFSTREILKAQITGRQLRPSETSKMINEELNLIKRADIVIAVSPNDKRIMEQGTGKENVEVWGQIQKINCSSIPFSERKNIVFLGSFFAGTGSPNEDAAIYFVNEIFPLIRNSLSCKLYVVGTDPTTAVKRLASDDIKVTGYVRDLREYFDMCKVNVVPTRFAAGVPIKLIEALSYGIPTVVSGLIASHLDLSDGKEVLVANNAKEFSEKVISLYTNETLWNTLKTNALAYVESNYSAYNMQLKMDHILKRGLEITGNKRSIS